MPGRSQNIGTAAARPRLKKALREALGMDPPIGHALKVCFSLASANPEKPFIAGRAMALQKKPEFLFGCHNSVDVLMLCWTTAHA
jgi:hypothetical protein